MNLPTRRQSDRRIPNSPGRVNETSGQADKIPSPKTPRPEQSQVPKFSLPSLVKDRPPLAWSREFLVSETPPKPPPNPPNAASRVSRGGIDSKKIERSKICRERRSATSVARGGGGGAAASVVKNSSSSLIRRVGWRAHPEGYKGDLRACARSTKRGLTVD